VHKPEVLYIGGIGMKTKILDCTIRDGGYLNNWQFSKQMVKDLYRAVSKSGVDFIEIGFKSSDKYFDPSNMGVWRFTPEEAVNEIVNEISGTPISLMVDYGKVELTDIVEASQSNVVLYRVAVHKNRVLEAIELANAIADKGYKVAIQLMGIVGYKEEDFKKVMGPLKSSKLAFVYFADSYGSLLPSDIGKYINILRDVDKLIGFHAHNNLQLAFANVLEAIRCGIDVIDGTVFGMGRGAGNLPIEALITYLEKIEDSAKYNVLPILDLIDKYFLYLHKELGWGYNLPYMVSGVYEVHPNYATNLVESGEYRIEDIQSVLQLVNKLNPIGFDKNIITQIAQTGFVDSKGLDAEISSEFDTIKPESYQSTEVTYKDRHEGRNFLILSNGPSLVLYQDKIKQFIDLYDPIIIGSNYLGELFIPHYHSFNNKKRFIDHVKVVHPDSSLLLSNTFSKKVIMKYTDRDYEIVQHSNETHCIFTIENGVIMNNCRSISVLSIATAIVMGAKKVFVAGMDGYKDFETFMIHGIHADTESTRRKTATLDISARSGDYAEQMEWHNFIDRILRQINGYLLSKELDDLKIITPTTHKLFYRNIESFF
jgi:4-hydroxy 2-oxovalerate aldolase